MRGHEEESLNLMAPNRTMPTTKDPIKTQPASSMRVGQPFNPQYATYRFSPADVVDSIGHLPSGAKRTYRKLAALAVKGDYAYPTQAYLAKALGKSARQIRNDLRLLEQAGLILRTKDHALRGYCQYWILMHSIFLDHLAKSPKHDGQSAAPTGWWTDEIPELTRELQRNRRIAPNGVERSYQVPPPDAKIVRQIAACFPNKEQLYARLRALPGQVDTSTIRSYGFYLVDAQRWKAAAAA
jgi:hypothetical protein